MGKSWYLIGLYLRTPYNAFVDISGWHFLTYLSLSKKSKCFHSVEILKFSPKIWNSIDFYLNYLQYEHILNGIQWLLSKIPSQDGNRPHLVLKVQNLLALTKCEHESLICDDLKYAWIELLRHGEWRTFFAKNPKKLHMTIVQFSRLQQQKTELLSSKMDSHKPVDIIWK